MPGLDHKPDNETKLNHKRDTVDPRDRLKNFYRVPVPFPPKASVSNLQPVTDQGSAGSCAGHAMAWMWGQVLGSRGLTGDIQFSPRYIYWFARLLDGDTSVDEGVTSRSAIKAINKYGVPPLDLWPGTKPLNQAPDQMAVIFGQALTLPAYTRCETLQDIKHSIAIENQSVFIGLPVFQNWYEPMAEQQGLIQYDDRPKQPLGGHATAIVGYDDDFKIPGQTGGALKLVNSWGTGWGMGGYFWLPYEYLQEWWDAWACHFEAIPDSKAGLGGAD